MNALIINPLLFELVVLYSLQVKLANASNKLIKQTHKTTPLNNQCIYTYNTTINSNYLPNPLQTYRPKNPVAPNTATLIPASDALPPLPTSDVRRSVMRGKSTFEELNPRTALLLAVWRRVGTMRRNILVYLTAVNAV